MEQNYDSSKKDAAQSFWDGNPKTMFALGMIAGVAIMSTVALVFVLNFLMSGKNFGALAANTNTTGNQVAQQPTANDPTANQPSQPSVPPRAVDKTDHISGPTNAKVTLIEYSDFECPYCLRHYDTVKQIQKDYPNDVRVIFRHFPLSFHANAQKAAEATECAGAQGKFWEMHDKVFAANKAQKMGVDTWKQDAKDLGLDTNKFNNCLDKGEMAARISADQTEGSGAGVGGTPATFVNGELVEGALPYEAFKTKIDAILKK